MTGSPIKIIVPFPYDRPDTTGRIFTKDAVERAIDNLRPGLQIVFRWNEEFEEKAVGATSMTKRPTVIWDEVNQTCQIVIDGALMSYGIGGIVKKIEGNTILDFEIFSIGLTMIESNKNPKKGKNNETICSL